MNIEASKLNERIDPVGLLGVIGYEKSHPRTAGGEVRDFCPIHKGDNQQSLAINLQTHCYICHNCGAAGDLIDLYMKSMSYDVKQDFPKALHELAIQFAIDMIQGSFPIGISSPIQKEHNLKPRIDTAFNAISVTPNDNAFTVWNEASEEGQHEYFNKKNIKPCPGIRFGQDRNGNKSIIVPFYSVDGDIQSLQYINNNGKFFLSGTHKKGCFFSLGQVKEGKKVYVAEGLATAITIWEALDKKYPVVSAGDAGNIPPVVEELRNKYQTIEIELALDNDEAGMKVKENVSPPFTYCTPSFEGISMPEGAKVKDFNDLISVCGQSIEFVRRQIQNENIFFEKLGLITGDPGFSNNLRGRTYDTFEQEHKKLFAGGGLISGFKTLDDKILFSKGDFVTIQAMSNHGKSTLMLQLAYKFITTPENESKNPMCIFITYESSPIRIEEKLLNLIGHDLGEGSVILYNRDMENKYLYPDHKDFYQTISTYNRLLAQRRIEILKRIPIEKIEEVMTLYQKEFPDRMIVLILDYFQIIDTNSNLDGWEKVKEVARRLEAIAITKEILIVTASQVNDRRQTREGRDLYNSSTTVIDILNHSHASLKSNQETEKLYKDKMSGEAVCTISAFKQKHGETFDLREGFLFNGFRFEEKFESRKLVVETSLKKLKGK